MKIALFASGTGSNVKAIIQAVESGNLEVELACLICDQPQAGVIEHARIANIPILIAEPKAYLNREAWEQAIVDYLQAKEVKLLVLAGFMRIIGSTLLAAFPGQIINLHPSLLPLFPGKQAIQDAYEAGATETGVTVHWVDSGIDTGEIIAQESVSINPNWSLSQLENVIHAVEHRLYPATIQAIISKA